LQSTMGLSGLPFKPPSFLPLSPEINPDYLPRLPLSPPVIFFSAPSPRRTTTPVRVPLDLLIPPFRILVTKLLFSSFQVPWGHSDQAGDNAVFDPKWSFPCFGTLLRKWRGRSDLLLDFPSFENSYNNVSRLSLKIFPSPSHADHESLIEHRSVFCVDSPGVSPPESLCCAR